MVFTIWVSLCIIVSGIRRRVIVELYTVGQHTLIISEELGITQHDELHRPTYIYIYLNYWENSTAGRAMAAVAAKCTAKCTCY